MAETTERNIQILDFEKPIYEIQEKIDDLRRHGMESNMNYDAQIASFERYSKQRIFCA